jgi:hypothetical protein
MNVHGFINHNSICYLNSILQCLLSSSKLVKHIVKNREEYSKKKNNYIVKLSDAFLRLILKNAKNESDVAYMSVEINKIMNILGQQCAAEMLLKIIEDLNLEHLFEQKIEKSFYCMNCNNIVSIKRDIAYINNISLEDNNSETLSKNFIKKINMDFNYIDDYQCNKCKKKTKLIILNCLDKVSDLFIISFNKYIKKDLIQFPENILLTEKKIKYQLIGIINHIGDYRSGGHYWSEIKRNSCYYNIDDTAVQKIDNFNIIKNNFILFYEKV